MSDSTKTPFDLNIHMARLLMDEPFFASISRRIDKTSSTAISTAGVRVNPNTIQFEMLYNPDFFEKLTDAERRDVLKHEFYHVVFMHVTDRMPNGVMTKHWNIATDLAINSHLNNLPEGGLIPGKEGTPFEDLPRGKSAEWYLANLPDLSNGGGNGEDQDKEEGESSSGGGGDSGDQSQSQSQSQAGDGYDDIETLDDHSGWGDVGDDLKEIAKESVGNDKWQVIDF